MNSIEENYKEKKDRRMRSMKRRNERLLNRRKEELKKNTNKYNSTNR